MHARDNRPGRARRAAAGAAGVCLGVTSAVVGLTAPSGAAAADDPTSASALAAAIAADPGVVTGAGFETRPPAGGTALASRQGVSGFPHDGAGFAILSTGEASGLYPGSGSQDEDRGGSPVRGSSADDVTILRVDVDVPQGQNCLTGVDFRFLSDEYPEQVGGRVNDAFVLEIDHSTWTTEASDIAAPDNLAFDEAGHPVSINAGGAASMAPYLSIGTTTSGSTRTFRATAPISPGAHRLFFSIFDQGDPVGDSDVLLDNLTFGHVDDPATGCRPGIVAPYGAPVTAPAATFDDGLGTVTIPEADGIAYDVNLADTRPGTLPAEAGRRLVVTATPTGDDFLTGPSAWTHTMPAAPASWATSQDPTFDDLPGGNVEATGTVRDTVTVPEVPGLDYALDGEPVAAGTYPADGLTTVTAQARPGYLIQGATTWSYPFTEGPWEHHVTSWAGPTADLEARTYTVPELTSGQYVRSEGVDVAPGVHEGRGTVELVTVAPGEAGIPWGANRWSFTFPGHPFLDAVAAEPTFTDGDDGHGTVEIPEASGVSYRIDRRAVGPGSYEEAGPTIVTAVADDDHGLDGVSGWSHTFRGVGAVPVEAGAPTVHDEPGTSLDAFTVPSRVGVRYLVDGDVAPSGANPAAGRDLVEVTAVAAHGYALTGTTTWRLAFSREPGVLTSAQPTTTGVPRVGRTLTALSGDWSPPGVTFGYQWYRGVTPIRGARERTYLLRRADRGHRVSVRVTGTRTDYEPAVRWSVPTRRIRR